MKYLDFLCIALCRDTNIKRASKQNYEIYLKAVYKNRKSINFWCKKH